MTDGLTQLVTFSLLVAIYLALVSRGIYPAPPLLLDLVIVATILFTGYDALQSLRDLVSGDALAQEDLLKQLYRGRRGRSHRGSFERLGNLRIVPKVFAQSLPGRRYRVVYSQASKTVWALEPPDERSPGW